MKTGLVMEGGAMRGMFTAGVTDVLMEHGVEFDGAIGVSAGATFGLNVKSRQPGRSIRYNMTYARDKRYASFHSLITTGDYYNGQFCYHTLPDELDVLDAKTFRENPMPFYVVVTDAMTGQPFYHLCHSGQGVDVDWVQASASMPIFAQPVRIGDDIYYDGGLADSIPLRFMETRDFEKNVVILTQPADYRKKNSGAIRIFKPLLKDWPAVYNSMKTRPDRYNRQVRYVRSREKEGAAFVICPPKALGIGKIEHDPQNMKKVYEIGREEGERRLPELLKFMAE